MLDKIDSQVEQWIKGAIGDVEVSFEPPSSDATGNKVGLYLMEVIRRPQGVGGISAPRLKFELRYLITAWSQQPKEAHRALGQILFKAVENKDFEVELEPLPATFWTAFQTAPRPSLVLRVPVYHEPPKPRKTLVTQPPDVRSSSTTALMGAVFGPNKLPLAGAAVELPNLGYRTTTNVDGEFRFAAVPSDPFPAELIVTVKGQEHRHELLKGNALDEPISIEIPLAKLQTAS